MSNIEHIPIDNNVGIRENSQNSVIKFSMANKNSTTQSDQTKEYNRSNGAAGKSTAVNKSDVNRNVSDIAAEPASSKLKNIEKHGQRDESEYWRKLYKVVYKALGLLYSNPTDYCFLLS